MKITPHSTLAWLPILRQTHRFSIAATLLGGLLSLAPPAISMELAGRAQELSWFTGSWACEGRRMLESGEQPFTARYDFAPVAGRAWLETHYSEAASGQNPMPLDIREFWGLDAPSGTFRNSWVNNFAMSGGFSSQGWQGEDFVWATDNFPMGDVMRPMQATFHRSGPNDFDVKPAVGMGGGTWRPIAEFACSRRP